MTPEQIEAFQTVMAATLSQSEQVFLDALCDLALKGLQADAMREAIRRAVGKAKMTLGYFTSDNLHAAVVALDAIRADLEQALNERKET
jgi:hypothetical protein